jgi:hypothetical protein
MPYLVSISTNIPKAKVFRFENFWMMHEEFMQMVAQGWDFPSIEGDKAKKDDVQVQKPEKGTKAMAGLACKFIQVNRK